MLGADWIVPGDTLCCTDCLFYCPETDDAVGIKRVGCELKSQFWESWEAL